MSVIHAPTQSELDRAAERRKRLVRLHVIPKPLSAVVSMIDVIEAPTQDPLPNSVMGDALTQIDDVTGGNPNLYRIMISDIQRVVADYYGVSVSDLMSARRTSNVVRPRQVAMYLAKTLTLRSLPEIGRRFGGRDHTTVLHATRKIGSLAKDDPSWRAEIAELTATIRSESHYKAALHEVSQP